MGKPPKNFYFTWVVSKELPLLRSSNTWTPFSRCRASSYKKGLLEDLGFAPSRAIVLLHVCAHNPTGVDPTIDQWEQITRLMRSKGLLPFFDSTHQDFASGSLDTDAQSVLMFVAYRGVVLVNSKLCKVCRNTDLARRVESQLKLVIRPIYSNPPIHGASIAAAILKDRNLYHEWNLELKAMADRIIRMRQQLFDALRAEVSLYMKSNFPRGLQVVKFVVYRTEYMDRILRI